jgi:hypothetical protein
MIHINSESGKMQIGEYVIYPHMTHEMFGRNYPSVERREVFEVKFDRAMYPGVSPDHIHYTLPPQRLFDQLRTVSVFASHSRYLTHIHVARDRNQLPYPTIEERLVEVVRWAKDIKVWLSQHFGTPHWVSPPKLIDEKTWLSDEQLRHLQGWQYQFPWGRFGYDYDWETGDLLIYTIDKQYLHQTWDGFVDHCVYQLRFYSHPKFAPMSEQQARLDLIKQAVSEIRLHFDYMSMDMIVLWGLRGLSFNLPHWSTRAILEVRPSNLADPYHLSRYDWLIQASVSRDKLFETLRVFLENKDAPSIHK